VLSFTVLLILPGFEIEGKPGKPEKSKPHDPFTAKIGT